VVVSPLPSEMHLVQLSYFSACAELRTQRKDFPQSSSSRTQPHQTSTSEFRQASHEVAPPEAYRDMPPRSANHLPCALERSDRTSDATDSKPSEAQNQLHGFSVEGLQRPDVSQKRTFNRLRCAFENKKRWPLNGSHNSRSRTRP